ncbi:MAG: M48 family metalloprotease [Steroidobacteraceae bacterium]
MTVAWMVTTAGAADLTATVRKQDIDVYAEPSLDSAKVAELKHDATVGIVSQRGLWYELKLADGRKAFVRVNDVRVNYGGTEDGSANLRGLTSGKAGAGRVSETAGVRGIDESDLQSAGMDQAQFDAMTNNRVDASAARGYAGEHGWQATVVAYDSEAKQGKGAKSSSADSSGALQGASGMLGSLGSKLGSLLGTANQVAPRAEEELAAEELALGPQIAGRVLGARPLWKDATAQQRVNVIGRWVASQTKRPDLPWTFGVIDTSEVNAFAAPGGYVLVTRGLYELLASDSEVAAVLAHEISHCVERDHYTVIRKQELATLGKDTVSGHIDIGTGSPAEAFARQYVEEHGATILLTSLDRQAEYRADKAAEIYLARSGMNPLAMYSVLQKMASLGTQSASLAALYKTHPPLDARMDRIDERGYGALKPYTTRE